MQNTGLGERNTKRLQEILEKRDNPKLRKAFEKAKEKKKKRKKK